MAPTCPCVVALLDSSSGSLGSTEPSAMAPLKADVWLVESDGALLEVLTMGTSSSNGVEKSGAEKSRALEPKKAR